MMKKLLWVLILAVLVAGGAFAEWYDSYAPGIEGSKIFINGGIGIGFLPYKMSIPPITASAEYALPITMPISVGAFIGYTAYDEDITQYNNFKGSMFGIGARASYHFNFMRNLDPYASLTLGYVVHSQKSTAQVPGLPGSGSVSAENNLSFFMFGIHAGARYFFTDMLGAYVEAGFGAIHLVSVGVSIKL